MLYELRVYEVVPGRMPNLVNRFVNTTIKMFRKHGIRPVTFLEAVIGANNELTYLLEWESLAEREAKWTAFATDPEWVAARAETEKDGAIVACVRNTILSEIPGIMAVVKATK